MGGGFIWNYAEKCCNFGVCALIFNSIFWAGVSLLMYFMSVVSFGTIYVQGEKNDEASQALDIILSPGGGMIIASIAFQVLGLSLATWQWAKDAKKAQVAAIDAAVARAAGPKVY